jgi:hypothetical protein
MRIAVTLSSDGIVLGPDAHRKARAAEQIVRAVRNALAFRDGLRGRLPTVGLQASSVIDWQAEIVAQFGSGKAFQIIPGVTAGPFAGEIELRVRG